MANFIRQDTIRRLDFEYIDGLFNEETCNALIHSLEKDRLVKWLQQYLSLTCIISKETYGHFIRLWIR